MRATGHPHTHNGEREGERENVLGRPLRMPQWIPDEGDGWILIVHVGGKAIYLRDELPPDEPPVPAFVMPRASYRCKECPYESEAWGDMEAHYSETSHRGFHVGAGA